MQDSSRNGTTQAIAFTGSSVAITNAFGAQTYQVRLSCNSHCHYQIGDGTQTASVTTSPFLPQFWVEFVKVTPGQRISAIRGSTDGNVTAASGSLFVTEMTA